MSTITTGVDLAKSVFSACEVDGPGRVLRCQDLKHDAFAVWLAQQPAGTVVAMEACSGAHHWARRCLERSGASLRTYLAQQALKWSEQRLQTARERPVWVDSVEKLASKISGCMRLEKLAATIEF